MQLKATANVPTAQLAPPHDLRLRKLAHGDQEANLGYERTAPGVDTCPDRPVSSCLQFFSHDSLQSPRHAKGEPDLFAISEASSVLKPPQGTWWGLCECVLLAYCSSGVSQPSFNELTQFDDSLSRKVAESADVCFRVKARSPGPLQGAHWDPSLGDPGRAVAGHPGAGAAEFVFPRGGSQACKDWVVVDVLDDGSAIGVRVHPLGVKAPAHKRPIAVSCAIEASRVVALELSEGFG
jgi:hypothetical protein